MALFINLKEFRQQRIYLEINIDNNLLTWNIHFMEHHISNNDQKTNFILSTDLGANLVNMTKYFFMNYSNDSLMGLSFRLSLRWFFFDSNNKVYLDKAISGSYPWSELTEVPVGKNSTIEAEINFTG